MKSRFHCWSGRRAGLRKTLGCAGVFLRWLFWKANHKSDEFPRCVLGVYGSSISCACGVCLSSSTRLVLLWCRLCPLCSLLLEGKLPRLGRDTGSTLCAVQIELHFPPAWLAVLSRFFAVALEDGVWHEPVVFDGYLIPGESDVVIVLLVHFRGHVVGGGFALPALSLGWSVCRGICSSAVLISAGSWGCVPQHHHWRLRKSPTKAGAS